MAQDTPGISQGVNPFEQLISDSQGNTNEIQSRYEAHRSNRNAQFRDKLLHSDFPGWQVDEILRKLHAQATKNNANASDETLFTDHRHNLNFYARPPSHIKDLVAKIQLDILDVAPTLWLTRPESLHATVLEVASSRTPAEIETLASYLLQSGTAAELVDYAFHHRARLVKPIVSYDAAAMAVSFVPAAGEPSHSPHVIAGDGDAYTYHHLRRDLAARVLDSGIQLAARYTVPSAHLTIARFITQDGFVAKEDGAVDGRRVGELVKRIERINEILKEKYWPREDGTMPQGGEWVVGDGEGLEFSKGTSWYGGGEKAITGRGF